MFVFGLLKANNRGWINDELVGLPLPISDVGMCFCRPTDKVVNILGTLAVDRKIWISSSEASSGDIGWSATYISA